MLIDSFILLNELDLLESRIEYLCGVVDKFLIVESNHTFNGNKKPLYFKENESRFSKWKHRIIYQPFIIDRDKFDYTQPNNFETLSGPQWDYEAAQRNFIAANIKNYSDQSIRIIIGDIDEIPNKDVIMNGFRGLSKEKFALTFEQDMFYYNFNKVMDQKWSGSVITTLEVLQNFGPQMIRNGRGYFDKIPNGGWHISNFNSAKGIRYKIENFSHQEFNKQRFTDLNNITKRIKEHRDLFDRQEIVFKDFDKSTLPSSFFTRFGKHESIG